jgi:C1A family cysteine protease
MFSWLFSSAPKRKYGWKHTESYSEEEIASRPELRTYKTFNYHHNLSSVKEIDNSKNLPPILDQGNLGSCTANSICANYEYQMSKEEDIQFPMSRLFLYYLERVKEGTDVSEDSGAQIKDGIAICKDQGLCLESLWPYDIDKFAEKPPQNCYDDLPYHKALQIHRVKKDLKDIDQCLLDGNVISFGFLVYESFEKIGPDGMCPIPDTKKEKFLGGHAVLLHSKKTINGKTYYVVQNSWGEGWGDKGMFYVEPEFLTHTIGILGFESLCSDLWTIQIVRDKNDPNISESDDVRLETIKKNLKIDTHENDIEDMCNKLRELIVNVEKSKTESV